MGYFGAEPTCARCDYPRRLHHLLNVAHDYDDSNENAPAPAATGNEGQNQTTSNEMEFSMDTNTAPSTTPLSVDGEFTICAIAEHFAEAGLVRLNTDHFVELAALARQLNLAGVRSVGSIWLILMEVAEARHAAVVAAESGPQPAAPHWYLGSTPVTELGADKEPIVSYFRDFESPVVGAFIVENHRLHDGEWVREPVSVYVAEEELTVEEAQEHCAALLGLLAVLKEAGHE